MITMMLSREESTAWRRGGKLDRTHTKRSAIISSNLEAIPHDPERWSIAALGSPRARGWRLRATNMALTGVRTCYLQSIMHRG